QFVFERWAERARQFWRPELTRDDYYAEFLTAYSYTQMGLHENPLDLAVSRAQAAPLPEVPSFSDKRIRLLVSICRELQKMTGANPFYLPTRKLGEVLAAHWTQVARWLRALEVLDIIHLAPGEIRRRGGTRSPRYYYGPPKRNTVGFVVTAPLPPSELPALLSGNQANNMKAQVATTGERSRLVTREQVVDVDCPILTG